MSNNKVALFEQKNMMAFIELHNIEQQKKELDARDKEIREIITKGMEENGIDSIDNDYVKITYIPPTDGKPKLDEKAWRAEDPEGYNKVFSLYNKMSGAKKGYVRITVR